MSKQRQRERAAREAAAAAAKEAARREAEKRAARRARTAALKPSLPKVPARQQVYRVRRFPPLPWRLKAALALGWVAVAGAVLLLVPSWGARLGLLLLATAVLPLIVVLVRDPTRRTR